MDLFLRETDPFQANTLDFILRHRLVQSRGHLLAAVSGGPDSMALLDCLCALRTPLEIARITVIHFNHQLRGRASSEDADFVRSFAKEHALPCMTGSEDVGSYREVHGGSLEMAARACRHKFFAECLTRCADARVALGHTADDQAEEVLLRLLRGTGPGGTAGLASETALGIVRPILWATRAEVMEYLARRRIPYRMDASNEELFCRRNVLRHRVFPVLREHFHGSITRTLARHAELVRDEEDWWRIQIESCWKSVVIEEAEDRLVLSAGEVLKLHPALQRRILRIVMQHLRKSLLGLYSVHVEIIREWMKRNKGVGGEAIHLPGGLRAAAGAGMVILSGECAEASSEDLEPLEIPSPGIYDCPRLRVELRVQERSSLPSGLSGAMSKDVAWMDARTIEWPMMVRYWKAGDRFRPLGSSGTRKLQDFFTDAKVLRSQRKRVPLLCDAGKICWIVGHRIDDRVRVTPETKLVLVSEVHIKD